MKNFKFNVISVMAAAVLVGCGGGGGSGGESHAPYSISLRAEKTLLPVNTAGVGPGQGVYAPYTTTLYVNATTNGRPIPGGEDDVFGCNVEGGLDTGSLYYLDGEDEHVEEVEVNGEKIKIPKAYRSITLGSNSGGNSFHFHAKNQAGVAKITCSVQDPSDKKNYAASIDITVGAPSGKAASIRMRGQSNTLGTQGNLSNLAVSTVVDVQVLDDADQPLPNTSTQNLQVAIRSVTGAAAGARLMAGGQEGGTLWINTVGGVGKFAIASGLNEGAIAVDVFADRNDNNVTNGIANPIIGTFVIPVVSRVATVSEPLVISTAAIPEATNGQPYSYVLEATGGQPPYTWAALSALPAGLSISSSGVISGTPNVRTPGTINFAVQVRDSASTSRTANLSLDIGGTAIVDPLAIVNCSASTNTACKIADVTREEAFSGYAFTVTGGAANESVAWTATGIPAWLKLSTTGILALAPTDTVVPNDAVCGANDFFVTATKGGASVTNKFRISVAGTGCP